MPADQLRPDERSFEELLRWDDDGFDTQLHGETHEGDHPHVMRQRQPARHHVRVDVEFQPVVQGDGIRGEIAVTDLDGLGHAGRSGCQLPQRDIRLIGVIRHVELDRVGAPQGLDGADGQSLRRQRIQRSKELLADDDHVGLDHQSRPNRVGQPDFQIGAGSWLLQHRHRGATQPGRLRERRDVGGIGGQHRDRTLAAYSPRGQSAGHPLRLFVDLIPGQPNRVGDRACGQMPRRESALRRIFRGLTYSRE